MREEETEKESKEKIRKELSYSSQHTEDGRVLDRIHHTAPKLQVHISIVLAPQHVHIIQFTTQRDKRLTPVIKIY